MNVDAFQGTRRQRLEYVQSRLSQLRQEFGKTNASLPASNNEFIQLLEENHCANWGCTTCRNMPFRRSVYALGERFYESMIELDEAEVLQYNNILEYVNIGIYCIPNLVHRQNLAEHWPNIHHLISVGTKQSQVSIMMRSVFTEFIKYLVSPE